jgi:hypothetical protein
MFLQINHQNQIQWLSIVVYGVGQIYQIKMNWNQLIIVQMHFIILEMIFALIHSITNVYQVIII